MTMASDARQPVAIIVPFRSLSDGKSRLASVLSAQDRAALNRDMLLRVLDSALTVSPAVDVILISPDRQALDLVHGMHKRITILKQAADRPGLNSALDQATHVAGESGIATTVVLPADLPLIRSQDIEHLIRRDAPIVIAPDRHRRGTNGLMQRLDATNGQFSYQFGVDSYWRHLEESHRLGLDAATAVSLGVSFDLDTPEDLDQFETAHQDAAFRVVERVGCA
jgi:2-phospho-L-lactate guanylyltransferase